MRKHTPNLRKFDAGRGNQVVANPQQALAVDTDSMFEQQVVVLGHRAVQAVLDRQHGCIDAFRKYRVDHVRRQRAGQDVERAVVRAQHLQRSHMAVGAALALYRNRL